VCAMDLEVVDGELLVLVGPSGCGKTTTLRIIAGLEDPTEGEVWIGGRMVNGVAPKDRDVAVVFQSYALYPHMTVFDNIAAALRLRGTGREEIRARVEKTAGNLGIAGHLRRFPRELSGGERQRVALARALVRQPRLFLLDEPLSNLDAQLRERARGELKALFKQLRATVVYVTHDQTEAMSLSDRVAVMREGTVEQVGTPEEIYGRPATVFVAGFVGSPRMNLFRRGEETVGIRPEDVRIADDGEIEMSVRLVEPLGPQRLLTLAGGGLELRALVPAGEPARPAVRVRLDPARLHRFGPEGRRVAP
ncbi:MAG: ABC transporter ATP-binding protein, partial [Planctomycetes bacterium]|nr:ABC transporter ATP-binding protein [Planctomycetota bacterium]